jgi:mannose-6-phosphate isomerase-like protein (cupin superfamily)
VTMKKITVRNAIAGLVSANVDYARLIEQDTFDIGFYRPDRIDPQEPHARDEVYIVAGGSGEFDCNGKTAAFGPSDLFFVPAGVEHRFKNFTDDFSTWVVFFGSRPK